MRFKTNNAALIAGSIILLCFSFGVLCLSTTQNKQQNRVDTSTHHLYSALEDMTDAYGNIRVYKPESNRATLVAFFCGCSPCRELASDWAHRLQKSRLSIVVVSSLGGAHTKEFERSTGLHATYLLDAGNHLKSELGIVSCPSYRFLAANGQCALIRDHEHIQADPHQEASLIQRVITMSETSADFEEYARDGED